MTDKEISALEIRILIAEWRQRAREISEGDDAAVKACADALEECADTLENLLFEGGKQ